MTPKAMPISLPVRLAGAVARKIWQREAPLGETHRVVLREETVRFIFGGFHGQARRKTPVGAALNKFWFRAAKRIPKRCFFLGSYIYIYFHRIFVEI